MTEQDTVTGSYLVGLYTRHRDLPNIYKLIFVWDNIAVKIQCTLEAQSLDDVKTQRERVCVAKIGGAKFG